MRSARRGGPEGRDGGWTQDPPGGPKVPVWHVCPQQGQQSWAAPMCLFRPPCGLSTSSLLSLANTVGGVAGGSPPRLALVAGSRDLGRGGLPGWPTPSVHSAHLLVLGKGTRPGLPALWVMTGGVLRAQKGCRQPSISSRCHRDPQLPSVAILVGKGFFFPVCLLSFSPPVFSSES